MDALTGLVALVGAAFALFATPLRALIVYLAVLFLYPDYLRVSMGTVDISATRVIISVLLLRCVADRRLIGNFRWNILDMLMMLVTIVSIVTLSLTTPDSVWIENRAGHMMDTLFVYFVIRLVVRERTDVVTIAKATSLIVVFLAIGGMIESYTGSSVYSGLGKYCPWAPNRGSSYQVRFNLNRAEGPYGETIMFGLFFASMLPLIWMLRYERGPWSKSCYLLSAVCVFGAMSTVSSGPYVALAVVLFCLALERRPTLIKPLIAMCILGCIAIELVSNRHFYAVIGEMIALDSATAWYRSQLINIAIERLPEYWAAGYGFADPGWGPSINELRQTDVVNHYVYMAVLHGLPGLFAFLAVIIASWSVIVRTYRRSNSAWLRSFAWALGSATLALMVAMWSVAIFTQMVSVYYVLFGFIGVLHHGFQMERASGSTGRRRRSLRSPSRQVLLTPITSRPEPHGSSAPAVPIQLR